MNLISATTNLGETITRSVSLTHSVNVESKNILFCLIYFCSSSFMSMIGQMVSCSVVFPTLNVCSTVAFSFYIFYQIILKKTEVPVGTVYALPRDSNAVAIDIEAQRAESSLADSVRLDSVRLDSARLELLKRDIKRREEDMETSRRKEMEKMEEVQKQLKEYMSTPRRQTYIGKTTRGFVGKNPDEIFFPMAESVSDFTEYRELAEGENLESHPLVKSEEA